MPLCINQSGTYRNARDLCVNQSGTYRYIKCGCINQANTYRCFGFTAATITSFTATPSSAAAGCSTTLCWTIANATSASISPTVGTISPAVTGSSVLTPSATTTFTLSIGGGGANPTCAITYTNTGPALGSSYCGGFLICKQSPNLRWVVSPNSSTVYRNWYSRDDASTRAQQVSGVGGWFIPTLSQFQNPGVQCLGYWDGYSNPEEHNRSYWTSTEDNPASAKDADITHGLSGNTGKQQTRYVRAFRTVSY